MSTYRTHNMKTPEEFDNCPPFLNNYLNYLNYFSNHRPSSVVEAALALREFCQYIHYNCRFRQVPKTADAHKDLDISSMPFPEVCAVSPEQAERYFGFLDLTVKNKSATIRKKMTFIRNFYEYIEANADELNAPAGFKSPMALLRSIPEKQHAPAVLTPGEIQQLVDGAYGESELRDRAIILLLASTAITTSELISLNRSDYDSKSGILSVKRKNRKENYHLAGACQEALEDYLLSIQTGAEGEVALFVGTQRIKRLTARGIQSRIHKICVNAGLGDKEITAQMLRDTAIVNALMNVPSTQRYAVLAFFGIESPKPLQRFRPLLPPDDFSELPRQVTESGVSIPIAN